MFYFLWVLRASLLRGLRCGSLSLYLSLFREKLPLATRGITSGQLLNLKSESAGLRRNPRAGEERHGPWENSNRLRLDGNVNCGVCLRHWIRASREANEYW